VPTEDTLLEFDTAARLAALDPSRSFIVQAPAGSGKTELLIQRYLRLLDTVESPEEVLAITFTRKAAQEMRLRVVEALRNARSGKQADSEHEQRTLALAAAVLARDAMHDWRIVEFPGRLRIDTVDAFSAGVARSLPLSSGLGGIATTVADAEAATLYREAAASTLDHLAAGGPSGEAVERVLRHLDNDIGRYLAYLARMLASREQWLGITGSGAWTASAAAAARLKLEQNIADVIHRQLSLLVALLPPACAAELPPLLSYAGNNLLNDAKADHAVAACAGTSALPSTRPEDRRAWHGVADLLLTAKGEWRKSVTKNDGFPADDKAKKAALYDLIERMRPADDFRSGLHLARSLPDPHYSDQQWSVLLALFELLPVAVAELRHLFASRNVIDHPEVALAAGRALGSGDQPGEAAMMLDYRVRHLLVDEMQDTSISQYGLIARITDGWTPGDGRTVFCVGDPMQSIYRFRDAEVGEFLLARERGVGGVPLESLTLRRNFRSGEHLVHWFNSVFTQVMPLKNDVAAGAIAYSESVPVEGKAGEGASTIYPLFDADPAAEARCSLGIIRRCLDEHPDDDVAVLVRSRSHLTTLLALLRQQQIRYQAVEIDRLTDLPELIDLIALVRALAHEGDRLAWLALLRGPWAGLRWADIHALVRNDRASTVRELIDQPARMAALTPDGRRRAGQLLLTLRPYIGRNATDSLRDITERAWCALGGPAMLGDDQQLENVYRLFDAIDRISVAGTLDDVGEFERRLDAVRVSGGAGSGCRLHLMTMHKAKGLQFDHVLLHGLGRTTRGRTSEVLSWLNLADESGRGEMLLSPVGPRAEIEHDPLYRYIEATEKEKDRLEQDRLLYVACTRAKKSLHLVGHTVIAADGEQPHSPQPSSLLGRLWRAVQGEYERAFTEWEDGNPPSAAEAGTTGMVLPLLRRFEVEWQAPSASSLPGPGRQPESLASAADEPVDFEWVGAATRHTGTIVHRWLQRIGEGRTDASVDGLATLRGVSRRWAVGLGVAAAELDGVCDQVENALKGILTDAKGRWVLFGPGECELSLSGVVDGLVQSIVIDRIRIDDGGTHWIVDYKTSVHGGGDIARFLRQEHDRYRPTLARYASIYRGYCDAPVRAALYLPLLQQFVEVDV